jgi:hypothetical protein
MHASASKVYISKQALKNILYDHAQFCGMTEDFKGLCEIKEAKVAAREASFAYERYRDLKVMPINYKSAWHEENENEEEPEVEAESTEVASGTDEPDASDSPVTTSEDIKETE